MDKLAQGFYLRFVASVGIVLVLRLVVLICLPFSKALASKSRLADYSKPVYYIAPLSVIRRKSRCGSVQKLLLMLHQRIFSLNIRMLIRGKEWDHDVKDANIFGEFKEGGTGVLIPVNGPKAKFEITEVTNNKSFTSQSKLPLCLMEFSHYLEATGTDTRVIHSVSFKGVTSFLFGRLIGGQIKKSLPQTLKNLKEACE